MSNLYTYTDYSCLFIRASSFPHICIVGSNTRIHTTLRLAPVFTPSNNPVHVGQWLKGGVANSHRTGLVGIARVDILRRPMPTKPLQSAKRAHYRGRGRSCRDPVGRDFLCNWHGISMVSAIYWRIHVIRMHTHTRKLGHAIIGYCQIFSISKRVSANDNSKQTGLLFTVLQ